ncbi:nucleoside hydrolase [Cohnella thailandensis]|uniref:Nucleoside hydrolase n=1 Tax=Cohnella thailandensis TaxID=557557 RepID=A0A841T3E2_9BACL|nr:nucleoside hydrolase [Cohnella thailandensis]MBB6636878.1 nucleoside hydrolase [Cohnella thailandensis]MBP1973242.1 purine nucleosidase [Cohnella thailandensis]
MGELMGGDEPRVGEPLRLVMDIGADIDGAFALLYALLSPGIRLEGITTSAGALSARQAADNALRLIRFCSPGYEIPVAVGEEGAWEENLRQQEVEREQGRKPGASFGWENGLNREANPVEGSDEGWADDDGRHGLGDALLAPSEQAPESVSAARFLAQAAKARPGELTLVLAGRASNWPAALALEPATPARFREVIAAGGTVLAPGDTTPAAERRFRGDPQAAAALFETADRLTAVGLDASRRALLAAGDLALAAELCREPRGRRAAELLRRLHAYRARSLLKTGFPLGSVPLHAVLGVLAAEAPWLFAFRNWRARVESGPGLASGMIVADRRYPPSDSSGRLVRFAMDVNGPAAVKRFLSALADPRN